MGRLAAIRVMPSYSICVRHRHHEILSWESPGRRQPP